MSNSNAENYVNGIFARACSDLGRVAGRNNTRGSILHDTQVEFAYLVRNINAGQEYSVQKTVSKIEGLVDKINNFVTDLKSQRPLPETVQFPINGKEYVLSGNVYFVKR